MGGSVGVVGKECLLVRITNPILLLFLPPPQMVSGPVCTGLPRYTTLSGADCVSRVPHA